MTRRTKRSLLSVEEAETINAVCEVLLVIVLKIKYDRREVCGESVRNNQCSNFESAKGRDTAKL